MESDDRRISNALVGRNVKITVKRYTFKGMETGHYEGLIESINPRMSLRLKENDYIFDHVVFCGISEGIHTMEDSEGNVLYRNDTVLGAYNKSLNEESERDALRSLGKFFI
ncbi:MAG: hypothetical protein HY367_00225 [Candidatus Aenigmarchaeota archaeon]|nr:hypothetical protein [Candidatus Aenigmarchaeota archaeon]